jgi:hypothetical protein
MQVALHRDVACEQVIDNRAQRKPKPDAIRKDLLPGGDRLVLRERNVSRWLLEHTGDDIFQRFGTLPESSSIWQVLPRCHLWSLTLVLVIDVFRSSRARANLPTVHVVLLPFAGHHVVLIPLLWALTALEVRSSWSTRAIRHGKLGADLSESGDGVYP